MPSRPRKFKTPTNAKSRTGRFRRMSVSSLDSTIKERKLLQKGLFDLNKNIIVKSGKLSTPTPKSLVQRMRSVQNDIALMQLARAQKLAMQKKKK